MVCLCARARVYVNAIRSKHAFANAKHLCCFWALFCGEHKHLRKLYYTRAHTYARTRTQAHALTHSRTHTYPLFELLLRRLEKTRDDGEEPGEGRGEGGQNTGDEGREWTGAESPLTQRFTRLLRNCVTKARSDRLPPRTTRIRAGERR